MLRLLGVGAWGCGNLGYLWRFSGAPGGAAQSEHHVPRLLGVGIWGCGNLGYLWRFSWGAWRHCSEWTSCGGITRGERAQKALEFFGRVGGWVGAGICWNLEGISNGSLGALEGREQCPAEPLRHVPQPQAPHCKSCTAHMPNMSRRPLLSRFGRKQVRAQQRRALCQRHPGRHHRGLPVPAAAVLQEAAGHCAVRAVGALNRQGLWSPWAGIVFGTGGGCGEKGWESYVWFVLPVSSRCRQYLIYMCWPLASSGAAELHSCPMPAAAGEFASGPHPVARQPASWALIFRLSPSPACAGGVGPN